MIFSKRRSKLIAFILAISTAIAIILLGDSTRANTSSLNTKEIDAIASQTTVVIGEGLRKGDIEDGNEWDTGSGVIVAHNHNTYYVLTNAHVVREPRENRLWGIRTADTQVHVVADTGENIIRFGTYDNLKKQTTSGYDLALMKFQSNEEYVVAVMGNSEKLHQDDRVLVSGWPIPEDLRANRKRVSERGKVAKIAEEAEQNSGYSILYSSQTAPGMSGGPVYNQKGELVGVHAAGRSRGDRYCIDPVLSKNNSCGIQTVHFITEAQAKQIQLNYNPPPVSESEIARGEKNKQRADFIRDIYALFTDLEQLQNKLDKRRDDLENLERRLEQHLQLFDRDNLLSPSRSRSEPDNN